MISEKIVESYEKEIERLNGHIDRLSIKRLATIDNTRMFFDKLIELNIRRKVSLQARIGELKENEVYFESNEQIPKQT